ncbi:MAG: sugar ABC transporter ATP-binding protein [Planctomycetes bacterium]|nr:sugar ABC transporter ATP-binding protein [Planctomycetota bacterium]
MASEALRAAPGSNLNPRLLSLRSISKSFPGIKALDQVDLEVDAGELVALAGENGAGKSTLIKIIAGIYPPDQGEIFLDGRPAGIRSVRDSMDLGISLIPQELDLADNLNIAENIFLGKQPYRGFRWFQLTSRREMIRRSRELMERIGLRLSPATLVKRLSPGQKQLVEIAKALSAEARLIIFDEPTSSLSIAEARRLFEVIQALKKSGVGILYVSHRLAEIIELADRVEVLRDGRHIGTLKKHEVSHPKIVSMMVGREARQLHRRARPKGGSAPALQVQGLFYPGAREPISFSVGRGEIVGVAGLVGSGRTELSRALFGIDPVLSGSVRVGEKGLRLGSVRDAIEAGLLLVPEDRKTQGLVLEASLAVNISFAVLPKLGRWGLLNRTAESALARRQVRSLFIRAAGLQQKVLELSGGNQQKVVLAKWLSMEPAVLILDEPTRGIDVGAKSELYNLIFDLAGRGVGLLVISSEMEEILAISDRVLVMHEGGLQGELAAGEITEENIMNLAVGKSR